MKHPSSRSRLNRKHLEHFAGETLFDKIGRVVCEAECLPRKELFEAWEFAKRVRRRFRGGKVIDCAAGHGLVARILLILDNTSPSALCVDPNRPLSFDRLTPGIEASWPRLAGRVVYNEGNVDDGLVDSTCLLVSVHGCGSITDDVITLAIKHRCRVAVLPCCQSAKDCDPGGLEGWFPIAEAVDATRVARLKSAEFDVFTTQIPSDVTEKNRLLIAEPSG